MEKYNDIASRLKDTEDKLMEIYEKQIEEHKEMLEEQTENTIKAIEKGAVGTFFLLYSVIKDSDRSSAALKALVIDRIAVKHLLSVYPHLTDSERFFLIGNCFF